MDCKCYKDLAGQSLGQVLTRFIRGKGENSGEAGLANKQSSSVLLCDSTLLLHLLLLLLLLHLHQLENFTRTEMDTLLRILKKLLASKIISFQCPLKGNEKETSADYHLSVVRKKRELNEIMVTEQEKEVGEVTKQEKEVEEVHRKEVLVRKKALVWDPRVQHGLLTASQLFNINQWLLSVGKDEVDDFEEKDAGVAEQDAGVGEQDAGVAEQDEVVVDSFDRMLDSFQDFGCSTKGGRLTTLV